MSSSPPVQICFELFTVGSVILVLHLGGFVGDLGGGAGAGLVSHKEDQVGVRDRSHREQPASQHEKRLKKIWEKPFTVAIMTVS